MSDTMALGPGEVRDFRDQLAVLRRRRIVVLVVIVVALAAALVSSLLQTTMYRARTDVLIRSTNSSGQVTFATPTALSAEVAFATRPEVRAAVREALGTSPSVRVTSRDDVSTVNFSAISDDPDDVALIANTYASIFIQRRVETRLTEYLATTQTVGERLRVVEAELVALDAEYLEQLNTASGEGDGQSAELPAAYSAE
ncbi:MAG: hypothetical protein ACO3SP_10555, partial [Ilumatobacteraceae bacterium]